MENTTENGAAAIRANLAIRSLFVAYEAALLNESQTFLTEVGKVPGLCPELPLEHILTAKLGPSKNTMLHAAVESGSEYITNWLVQQWPGLIRIENRVGDTALHIAARAGNEVITKLLVDQSRNIPDPEATTSNDDQNQTRNRRNIVPLLRMKNSLGNTALHEAVIKCNLDTVTWLISADPEATIISNSEHKSPMYLAVESGAINLLSCLLEHCHQVAFDGRWWKSPVHAAIELKRLDMLEEMISKMPQFLKQRSDGGLTLLQYASSRGNFGAIDLLLEKNPYGIFDESFGLRGNYALHFASESGCIKSFKKLLQAWPYPSEFLNKRRQNVLHIAALNGRDYIARYILGDLKLGHKFANAKDTAGNTPLHLATMNGHYLVVGSLIFSGKSDPLIENKRGFTAYDLANERARGNIVDSITQYGESYVQTYASLDSLRERENVVQSDSKNTREPYSSESMMTLSILFAAHILQVICGRLPTEKLRPHMGMRVTHQETKETANSLLVVAALIAGVAFAGTIQMPGGDNIQGQQKMRFLQLYTFFNSLALNISVLAAIILCWVQMVDENLRLFFVLKASALVGCSLFMGCIAFGFAVQSWLEQNTSFAYAMMAVEAFFFLVLIWIIIPLIISAGLRYLFVRTLYLASFFVCYATRRIVDFCLRRQA